MGRTIVKVVVFSFGHYHHINRSVRLQKGAKLLEMAEKQIESVR